MPIVSQSEHRYISLAQAAASVSLSPRTLRRAIAAGRLRANRIGRLVRIDVNELWRWIEEGGAAPESNRQSGV